MEILLTRTVPCQNGLYICQAGNNQSPHVVLVEISGQNCPKIIFNNHELYFKDFPDFFLWSDLLQIK
jgi:hypothetical protein